MPDHAPKKDGGGLEYSVVLPVFNEETCLDELLGRIAAVMDGFSESYEVICVDDGSSDATWSIIERRHGRDPRFKGVKFLRNFGHQLAIFAGIRQARGELIAVMDADGQDPPEFLPRLFEKCREGYDVVYAVRRRRKEGIFKKAAYKIFYRFYRMIVPFEIPLDAGDFSAFHRDVARFISTLGEKHPFIRGLRSWRGGRQCGLEYERHARVSGKVKYSFYKLFHLAINATVSFSKMPLRFISLCGIVVSFFSILFGLAAVIQKITIGVNPAGWTSLAVLVAFLGGLNLFVLGIIGEYVGQIFDEVKNRPAFLIKATLGFDSTARPSVENLPFDEIIAE